MKWFEAARQGWILEMLQIYGFINREHLRLKFGISEPQASKDLQRFMKAHPGMMQYDLSRKCYTRTEP